MISVGLVVPHSPLLIPEIANKENDIVSLEATVQGMLKASILLNIYEPDVVLFVTASGLTLPDKIGVSIPVNNETSLRCDFGDYDLNKDLEFKYDLELSKDIFENIPDMNLVEQSFVDYSLGVPLYYFSKAINKEFKIVHLNCSLFGSSAHFEIGKDLYNLLSASDKKIAIVVSGELGELNSEIGTNFEDVVRMNISEFNKSFLYFDPYDLDEIGESIYKPLSLYFGVMGNKKIQNKELSYEAPYGIGLLCAQSVLVA